MKRMITLFTTFFMLCTMSQAQVLLAKWTFPTGNPADSIADGGLPVNLDKAIHTEGGTSAIDFSKNGASTKSAQATGWDNGSGLKYWIVPVNTVGYENLKLSSKMQSGGNNPGPRDWNVQYRIGTTGEWTDVPVSTVVVTNDWGSAVLDSIALPAACFDQASLYLRWIMTSNTNSNGETVTSSGINKIDDIYVIGKIMTTGIKDNPQIKVFSVYPNPTDGCFMVEAFENISAISVFNSGGRCVYNQKSQFSKSISLKLDSLQRGTYFIKILTISGKEGDQKVVIL